MINPVRLKYEKIIPPINMKRPVEEANGPKDLLSIVFSMIIIILLSLAQKLCFVNFSQAGAGAAAVYSNALFS
jgi:hypothetical protein